MLILLALQSNSTGSVQTNDGTLGAEIIELKFGVAAPTIDSVVSAAVFPFSGKKLKNDFFIRKSPVDYCFQLFRI